MRFAEIRVRLDQIPPAAIVTGLRLAQSCRIPHVRVDIVGFEHENRDHENGPGTRSLVMDRKVCCMVLVAFGTLLLLSGCNRRGVTGPPPVHIKNCDATPPTVDVHEGDKVEWDADDTDYSLEFSDHAEPTANPFPVKHGVSNSAHPIQGHRGCQEVSDGYLCKYTITKANEAKPCRDPGVHIVK